LSQRVTGKHRGGRNTCELGTRHRSAPEKGRSENVL
jgi:hypothetical protein